MGLDGVGARAVALDRDGRIVAVHRGRPGRDAPEQVLKAFFASGIGPVDRVVAILPPPMLTDGARVGVPRRHPAPVDGTRVGVVGTQPALAEGVRGGVLRTQPALVDGARVGVLRIGAPAATVVPPLVGWARTSLVGPVRMVRGGHEYDGRVAADLDLPAVAEFARACAGRVDAVAVAGVHALENPEHEQQATALLADELGPDIPVVRGAETEAIGLLEREHTAVLDAMLANAAATRIDALATVLRTTDAELYVVRGEGTVLPAADAHRHATAWLGAARGSLIHGAARLAGVSSAVVVEVGPDEAVVGVTVDGVLPDSGVPREIEGLRTGLRMPRLTVVPRERLAEVLARQDDLPVVDVGETLPPEERDLVAAVGAATAEAAGSVDRIFWQGSGGRQDAVTRARRLAADAALRAGADPARLREIPVREALMTYVPVPAARLQVMAIGPVLDPAEVISW
ncbi:hydantoinase/oxoprolinase N-terminal domain-containing protein [Amycolatopsis jejuensis]|uniref:hydantoinase/oxoprolinase N-terminal domain-containing protein n=1 Tax=Amycolatopsis jejuensis TaxID=330084 RepID=UPI000B0BE795